MSYQLPKSQEIVDAITAKIMAGVPVTIIFDEIKDWKDGPKSYTTFYKIYRKDISYARGLLHQTVGKTIYDKAVVDKDMAALTLLAKGRLGWSEKHIVETADPDEEDKDTGPIESLFEKLKIKYPGNEEE